MAGLTIGKFAAAEGVGVETVRFYHRRGLLALPERGAARRAAPSFLRAALGRVLAAQLKMTSRKVLAMTP